MDEFLLNALMTVERKHKKRKMYVGSDEFYFGHIACEVPGDIQVKKHFLPALSSEKGFGQKLKVEVSNGKIREEMG